MKLIIESLSSKSSKIQHLISRLSTELLTNQLTMARTLLEVKESSTSSLEKLIKTSEYPSSMT